MVTRGLDGAISVVDVVDVEAELTRLRAVVARVEELVTSVTFMGAMAGDPDQRDWQYDVARHIRAALTETDESDEAWPARGCARTVPTPKGTARPRMG